MIVQVYGVTTAEDAAGVASFGPDHVGVVLDEGIDTWDSVDSATARAIVAELAGHVRVVALSLSTDVTRIRRTVDELEPDIVHLARAVDGFEPGAVASLRSVLEPVHVMTTVPVRGPEALRAAEAFARSCWTLLIPTPASSAPPVSCTTGH